MTFLLYCVTIKSWQFYHIYYIIKLLTIRHIRITVGDLHRQACVTVRWSSSSWYDWRCEILCLGRFVPRHDDELELEVDDPLLVEVQSEDYWYEGYNMRTGARGIFPAYYAIEVTKDPESYKGTNIIFNPVIYWEGLHNARNDALSLTSFMLSCYFPFLVLCSEEQWVDGQIPAEVPGLSSGALPQGKRCSVCSYAEGTRPGLCPFVCL